MSQITVLANAAGTGTVTLQSPATNTNRTVTLPDVTGTLLANTSSVIQPRGIPLFSAYQSTSQSLTATVFAKLNMQTEEADTSSWFDTTLSRYTPQAAGWYQCMGAFQVQTQATQLIIAMYKNGVNVRQGINNTGAGGVSMTALIYMNGTSDYIELWGYSGVTQGVTNLPNATYFQGYLVRAD